MRVDIFKKYADIGLEDDKFIGPVPKLIINGTNGLLFSVYFSCRIQVTKQIANSLKGEDAKPRV